jgi:hypothetical protein
MGKSFQADIPGNRLAKLIANASIASNGANGYVGGFVAFAAMKIQSAWRLVLADEATQGTATTSASYRRHRLLNGGSAGTATTIMASLNQTASQGSLTTKAFSTTANNSASAGEVIWQDQLTVGGAANDGTIVAAGLTHIIFELL